MDQNSPADCNSVQSGSKMTSISSKPHPAKVGTRTPLLTGNGSFTTRSPHLSSRLPTTGSSGRLFLHNTKYGQREHQPQRRTPPSLHTDVAGVRKMEQSLVQLLQDFHSGKLQAFGQDITFEKMEAVREQQEKLAKLHFDLNSQQEIFGYDTEEGKTAARENIGKLMDNLQQLSNFIEQLQSRNKAGISPFLPDDTNDIS